jgi:branched-chain amino acid transport system ATP-binding protein
VIGASSILEGVTTTVSEREFVCVIGTSGGGKTTLLRTIAGAQPAATGAVRYDGTDITAFPPHRRIAAGISMVPEGRRLFGSLTVEENILVGAAAGPPGPSAWPLERIYETFPLAARRHRHRASQLSGGEQQAVAIARALAASPSLLLLDEISLGLAPLVVGELYETLASLRETGTTMILVEQDLGRALAACDTVVCLLEGRVALTAPSSVSRDEVVDAYFGHAEETS